MPREPPVIIRQAEVWPPPQRGPLDVVPAAERHYFAGLAGSDLAYALTLFRDGEPASEASARARAATFGKHRERATYQRLLPHKVPRGRFAAAELADARPRSPMEAG